MSWLSKILVEVTPGKESCVFRDQSGEYKNKASYLHPEADSLITDSVKLLLICIHYLENYILVLISFFFLIHCLMKKNPQIQWLLLVNIYLLFIEMTADHGPLGFAKPGNAFLIWPELFLWWMRECQGGIPRLLLLLIGCSELWTAVSVHTWLVSTAPTKPTVTGSGKNTLPTVNHASDVGRRRHCETTSYI